MHVPAIARSQCILLLIDFGTIRYLLSLPSVFKKKSRETRLACELAIVSAGKLALCMQFLGNEESVCIIKEGWTALFYVAMVWQRHFHYQPFTDSCFGAHAGNAQARFSDASGLAF